jgi:hypothetical protein
MANMPTSQGDHHCPGTPTVRTLGLSRWQANEVNGDDVQEHESYANSK